jgi:hypothetical protein
MSARLGDGYALRMAGVSGVCGHVPDHRIRLQALGVQVGVGVVLSDAPNAVPLVPERRPGGIHGKECGDTRGGTGVGRVISSVI